jgi:hypothetical protein
MMCLGPDRSCSVVRTPAAIGTWHFCTSRGCELQPRLPQPLMQPVEENEVAALEAEMHDAYRP